MPETVKVRCPNCSARLNAKETHIGRRIKCPKCAEPFVAQADEVNPTPVAAQPERIERPMIWVCERCGQKSVVPFEGECCTRCAWELSIETADQERIAQHQANEALEAEARAALEIHDDSDSEIDTAPPRAEYAITPIVRRTSYAEVDRKGGRRVWRTFAVLVGIAVSVALGMLLAMKFMPPVQVEVVERPETETEVGRLLVEAERAVEIRERCYDEIRQWLKFDPEFIQEEEFISDGMASGEVRVFNGFNAATRANWSAHFDGDRFDSLRVGGFHIYRDGDLVLEGSVDYSE